MSKILFPFGGATVKGLTATGAQALFIENMLTIIDGSTIMATGNRTLNLSVDEKLKVGATIYIKLKTSATETTSFGTKMLGKDITGVLGKTKCTIFVFDGSNFIEMGTPIQID